MQWYSFLLILSHNTGFLTIKDLTQEDFLVPCGRLLARRTGTEHFSLVLADFISIFYKS